MTAAAKQIDYQIPLRPGQGRGPISCATEEQLESYIRWQQQQFDSGKVEERFVHLNERTLKAAELELARRRKGAQRQQPRPVQPPPAAIVKAPPATLGIAVGDPAVVTQRLRELADAYHIVGPTTQIDTLPEGFGVSIGFVTVSTEKDLKEVYSNKSGGLSLAGVVIDRLSVAAAMSWDPEVSRRLDDGSHPHYCHFRAVGYLRNFDNTLRAVSGEVEIDLRDGSEEMQEILANAAAANPPRDGHRELTMRRKFILRLAESAARNRATAKGLGIKRAYTLAELAKPFAIPRLTFTGQSQDPELRREFARMNAAAAIGGASALYGGARAAALPAPAASAKVIEVGHAPPPVGSVERDGDAGDPFAGFEGGDNGF